MDNWFYAQEGQQHGPVSFLELQRLAATGVVRAQDQVWSASLAGWQPAASVEGLTPARPPFAPPLPMQPPYPSHAALNYAGPIPAYPGQPAKYDTGTKWLLPVGRSGWAIAAGYVGLISVALIPAPVAVIMSLIAISHLKKNPTLSGWGRAIFGLVMGLLFSAVLLLVLFYRTARRY